MLKEKESYNMCVCVCCVTWQGAQQSWWSKGNLQVTPSVEYIHLYILPAEPY